MVVVFLCSYSSGIPHFQKHLESIHQINWDEWNELEKVGVTSVGLEEEKR
jgi:hypothetical protein